MKIRRSVLNTILGLPLISQISSLLLNPRSLLSFSPRSLLMLNPIVVLLFSSVASLVFSPVKSHAQMKQTAKPPRPNIIVILADDLGFSDIGAFGGEIHTPHLDYLAENGTRYTQFYNTSRCCPTRASLLTGLYNHQAGIGNMTDQEDAPGYQGYLADGTVTIAEVLKSAGYQTGMSGKWHVSNTNGQKTAAEQLQWLNHQKDFGDFSPVAQYPTSRGFDKYFGNIWGVVDFFDPFSLVSGTQPVKNVPKDYYHTDAINDTAVAYIRNFAKDSKPFFLYVAQTAPHWPLMAKPKDIAKYEDTYKAGWDVIREERYQRMKKSGIIDSLHTPLSKRWNNDLAWADNPDKEWDARAMAVHAAMIDCMDQGIGRIIDALRETRQLDNTLIIFLSDNGASAENCTAYGPGFDRPNQTRDGRPIAYDMNKKILPGNELSYASIGPRWANVANTPFQLWKAESYEGGVHTPMIAFWPKGIKTKIGGINKGTVGHVMDLMPTFVELSGAKYPASFRGHKVFPTSGISLVPSFKGKEKTGHDMLFNEHFGARYARSGDWKLVSKNDQKWQLFNLAQDRSETKDLAIQFPEKVTQLDSLWKRWANTHQVFPKPKKTE